MDTRYSATESAEIIAIIRKQINLATFMTLGASDFAYTTSAAGNPTFVFTARIIPTGKRSPRKMHVYIEYTPLDLYDITVRYTDGQWNRITHHEARQVDVAQLNPVLFALDREG